MKKDNNLIVSDAGKSKPGCKKQWLKTKYDSYFDGLEYRGFQVKTLLIREHAEEYKPFKIILGSKSVYDMFKPLQNLDHERFYTVVIDNANRVVAVHLSFQGTLNQSLVHPREIFKVALLCSGAGVILVHNHPSGKTEPSTKDFILTQRLVEAGQLLGIEVLDHVIIGYDAYYSFSRSKTLKNP